jgi:hypothetical protein
MIELAVVAVTCNRPIGMLERWAASLAAQEQAEQLKIYLVSYGSGLLTYERLFAKRRGVYLLEVERAADVFRQGRGLNIGLRHALNLDIPYTLFCNVDGLYAANFCTEVLRALREDDNAVAVCRRYDEDREGKIGAELRSEAYLGDCIALATPRAVALGGFDEYYTNWGDVDLDFVQRCTDNGMTKKWLNEHTRLVHQWHEPSPYVGHGHGAYREKMRYVLVRNQGQEWGQR